MLAQQFFVIFGFSAQFSQVVVAEINPDTLGVVDRSLFIRFLNLARFNSQVTAADLYINNGGLYLLPENIQSRGIVSSVCGYGYTKVEFESLLWKPNTTEIDPLSLVRPFVYVVLLRAVPGDASAYQVVYPPAVLHHDINPDCLSVADGLNWMTESGDRIGAFIPNDCVDVENLQGVFVTEEVRRQFRTLCPSQVNLIPSLEYPSNGTYVANTSSVGIEEVIDGLMFSMNQFEEVSVHINMNVTTMPGKSNMCQFKIKVLIWQCYFLAHCHHQTNFFVMVITALIVAWWCALFTEGDGRKYIWPRWPGFHDPLARIWPQIPLTCHEFTLMSHATNLLSSLYNANVSFFFSNKDIT